MTFTQFWNRLCQCGITACSLIGTEEPTSVVISGPDGDHAIAAVHMRNGQLIFDRGRKL